MISAAISVYSNFILTLTYSCTQMFGNINYHNRTIYICHINTMYISHLYFNAQLLNII